MSESMDVNSSLPQDPPNVAATELPVEDATNAKARTMGTGALVAAGSMWLILQTLGTKAVGLITQLVLAGLLAPKDFGQIGLAYTVTSFVALLINPGIDIILVRRGRRFHLWSSPAFYFSLATGLLGCVVILAVAPLVARLYDSQQLVGLLSILAISTPIGSLMLVPSAKLRLQMRFGQLATINLFQMVLQNVLTLAFAATGFGVYAFVLPYPLVFLASAVLLWMVARPTVKLRSPLRHWKYLIGDSSFIFGTLVLQTAVGQGDYILLGALYGASLVGPYFFAFGIASQAIRLTAGSLQLVLMAGLSRMTAFSTQQTQAALRATKALALMGTPLCLLQAAVAGPLLRGLYGDKWVAAIPLVQLISVGMALDVTAWAVGSLLQSRGQFRFLFLWAAAFAPVFLVAVLIGGLYGEALGVAIAVCAYYVAFSPSLAVLVFRASGVSWGEILGIYVRPIVVGVLAAGASLLVIKLSAMLGCPQLLQFGLAVCIGLATMALGARFVMTATWDEIMARFRQLVPSLMPLKS